MENLQSALDQLGEENNTNFDLMIRWLRRIVTDSGHQIVDICDNEISKLGRENQKLFLIYTINMFRQIILLNQAMDELVFLQGEERAFREEVFRNNFFGKTANSDRII